MRKNFLITWVLIFTLLVQGIVPVFAGQDSPVASSYDTYQHAYSEYVKAVQSQASLDEINGKLDIYLEAQRAYKETTGLNVSAEQVAPQAPVEQSAAAASAEVSTAASDEGSPVAEARVAEEKWHLWRDFQAKIVGYAQRLLGATGNPGEMPLWERVAWTIGKSLLPTMGVIIATALLAPLTSVGMVIGGIVTGAALGGLMTYAFEKRMNAKYRTVKKEDAKIWRDVSVQAVIEAVMAPFNLATGGMFGMVGPTVGRAIGKVALTQAGITFVGRALSSQVGGAVKNLWSVHYFKYPEKIEANEARIDEILNAHLSSETPFSDETVAELDRLRAEIEMMRSEHYTREDAVKDLKRAGVSAVISGFAGSIVSDRAYNSTFGRWADRASVRLFSTMPVNFASGMAGASLEKSFVSGDIKDLRNEQKAYAAGTPVFEYYEKMIAEKEQKRASIDATKAGFDTMIDGFAVHAARLTVDAIKYNVYDGPKARKAAVENLYREQDPNWKKAAALQQKYEDLKKSTPNPLRYRNPATYAKALAGHVKQLDKARSEWLQQSASAQQAEALPQNVNLKKDLSVQYERDVKLNQMLELGRLRGGDAHLAAMKKVLQSKNPELADASDERMTELAALAIKKTYEDKFVSSSAKAENIEKVLEMRRQHKAGKLALSPEEAKLLAGRADVISPSQYKAALVEKYVYDLKTQNVRWDEVERQMPAIMARAEKQMLTQYNNNWAGVLTAEAYANGLARYKYNPEGYVNFGDEMKKIVADIPRMIKNNLLGEYTREVNDAITSNIIPQNPSNDLERYLSTFGKTAINEATGDVIDTVYNASSQQLRSSFFP